MLYCIRIVFNEIHPMILLCFCRIQKIKKVPDCLTILILRLVMYHILYVCVCVCVSMYSIGGVGLLWS